MRKHLKSLSLVMIIVFSTTIFSGCYGNLTLSKKVYNWNGTIGTRVVNSVVMCVLSAVQVYSALVFIDLVLLNSIEFLTGKNPLAMADGEIETRIVENNGKLYQIVTTKNRIEISEAHSSTPNKTAVVYDQNSGAWLLETANGVRRIAEMDDSNPNIMTVIHPDGHRVQVALAGI